MLFIGRLLWNKSVVVVRLVVRIHGPKTLKIAHFWMNRCSFWYPTKPRITCVCLPQSAASYLMIIVWHLFIITSGSSLAFLFYLIYFLWSNTLKLTLLSFPLTRLFYNQTRHFSAGRSFLQCYKKKFQLYFLWVFFSFFQRFLIFDCSYIKHLLPFVVLNRRTEIYSLGHPNVFIKAHSIFWKECNKLHFRLSSFFSCCCWWWWFYLLKLLTFHAGGFGCRFVDFHLLCVKKKMASIHVHFK